MTDKIDDGGPAFPRPISGTRDPLGGTHFDEGGLGMSLRDWFAGEALAGIMAADIKIPDALGGLNEVRHTPEAIAKASYDYADAMLKARPTPRKE